MSRQLEASRSKQLGVLIALILAIFGLGALIGFGGGISGDNGNTGRAAEWAWKTGLLLLVMTVVIGALGGLMMPRSKLPTFVKWAILFALAFAIMDGGGVLIGASTDAFWPSVFTGLATGALAGAITGRLLQRMQTKRQPGRAASSHGE